MPDAAQPLVESARNWIRWRAAKRASLLGWLGVFAGQAVAGAIVFSLLLLVLGAPFNAATIAAPLSNETVRSLEKPPINTATLPKFCIIKILSLFLIPFLLSL